MKTSRPGSQGVIFWTQRGKCENAWQAKCRGQSGKWGHFMFAIVSSLTSPSRFVYMRICVFVYLCIFVCVWLGVTLCPQQCICMPFHHISSRVWANILESPTTGGTPQQNFLLKKKILLFERCFTIHGHSFPASGSKIFSFASIFSTERRLLWLKWRLKFRSNATFCQSRGKNIAFH